MSTKNTKQEIPTDKRTKAYKIWKANHEKQSKGLGDSISKRLQKLQVSRR